MNSETNSYSILIRDGLFNRIKALPFFANISRFGRTPARQIQAEHVPFLGCYICDEDMMPDGDPNHAEPRFTHDLTIGFSYILIDNDDDNVEDMLDAGHWAIMNMLSRQDWHTFRDDDGNFVSGIESIPHITRAHFYGNAGRDNETAIAEMRMEMHIKYRTSWPPFIPDMLEHVHIKTVYPWPEDPNRQPVITEIDIETE